MGPRKNNFPCWGVEALGSELAVSLEAPGAKDPTVRVPVTAV